MKKTLLILTLIAITAITFFACTERNPTHPLDSAYWDGKEVAPVATLIHDPFRIDSVRLSWTAPEGNPDGYKFRLDKKTGAGEWQINYKIFSQAETKFTDFAEINQAISYKIYVYFDENISVEKDKSYTNTFPVPTNLNSTPTSITSANLTWTDNSKGEDRFVIMRKFSTAIDYDSVGVVTGCDLPATKSWSDLNLIPNLIYDYQVRAVKGKYKSVDVQKSYTNTFLSPVLTAVTQLTVSSFKLDWTYNSTGADGFKIERKIDDGIYTPIVTLGADIKTYTDNSINKKGYTIVYYRIKAYKGTYESLFSEKTQAISFPAPTNLLYTKVNINTIKLDWNETINGEDGFKIDKKIETASWAVDYDSVGSNVITWSDPSAEINESMQYRVYAYKGANTSSSIVTATIDNTFPMPALSTVTQLSVSSFKLDWTDNSIGEEGFKIERKIDDGIYTPIVTLGADIKTYTDNSINKKGYTIVYYRIKAYKGTYESLYSEKTQAISFPAPTNLLYTKVNINTIKLDWNETINGEDGFKIDKKVGIASWAVDYDSVGSNAITWSDPSAEINESIQYRVYAYKGFNSSDSIVTSVIDNTLPAPTNLTASVESETSIKLDWTDNSNGEQGFKIDRKVGAAGTWVTDYATVSANVKSYTNTGLTTGTTYYYRVRAYYSTYYSSYTSEINAYIEPPAPTGFVSIPTGSFSMGSTTNSDEQPIHTVNITRPYYLGKYEVTQQEWLTTMGSNPSYFTGDLNRPVEQVSWYSILVYCNKRSIAEGLTPCYTISGSTDPNTWGSVPTSSNATWNAVTCNFTAKGYRLPTEAEWEYAARYNDGRTYPWGEAAPSTTLCNYNSNVGATTAVGSYPSGNSNLGLCDMAGNVWEWVWDWYATYPSATETDPDGPDAAQTHRVLRGGSWGGHGGYMRGAYRGYGYPYDASGDGGFRLSRTK